MHENITIRAEQPEDIAAIRAVNLAAFPTTFEANLVDRLRQMAQPTISQVAIVDAAIVGHIFFSPVHVSERDDLKVMGLAPMAVLPAYQRQGIGSALIRSGLAGCQALGYGAVVVLGHPSYYPRFGFVSTDRDGLRCVYDVPVEAFMMLELQPGYLQNVQGIVTYHPAFDGA